MAYRLASPDIQFLGTNSAGLVVPLAGGKLYFYLTGTNTPATTFQDNALTIPNTNPIVLDALGYAGNIFLSPGQLYKVVLTDANGVQQFTIDPVSDPTSQGVTVLNSFAISGAPGTSRTLFFETNGLARLSIGINGDAESGSNAGSNGVISTYDDTGAFLAQVATIDRATGAVTFAQEPSFSGVTASANGRLTLASGVPIMTTSVPGATSVFFTPYRGNQIPLSNGVSISMTTFTEMSQALSDVTKSPAAAIANSVYDIFFWMDGTTPRISRGPAWVTATSRGTGVGSTALVYLNGLPVNQFPITNGPGASFGTYLGTIATNASATVDYIFGAAASGGTAASLKVWNYYNRVPVSTVVQNTIAAYSYNNNTWRQANASAGMQISFVVGLQETPIFARWTQTQTGQSNQSANSAIGLDSTTAPSGQGATSLGNVNGAATGFSQQNTQSASLNTYLIGSHFVAALESSNGANVQFNVAVNNAGTPIPGNALQLDLQM